MYNKKVRSISIELYTYYKLTLASPMIYKIWIWPILEALRSDCKTWKLAHWYVFLFFFWTVIAENYYHLYLEHLMYSDENFFFSFWSFQWKNWFWTLLNINLFHTFFSFYKYLHMFSDFKLNFSTFKINNLDCISKQELAMLCSTY